MGYGQDSKIGISFQNSYGTALQNSVFWTPFLSETLKFNKEILVGENLRRVYDEGQYHVGAQSADGSIEVEPSPNIMGAMIKCVLGDPVTVASDSLKTHTFKPRTADWDAKCANVPVTIERYAGVGSSDLFSNMTGTTLRMSIAHGELMKMGVDFVGGDHAQQAVTAESFLARYNQNLYWDSTSISFGGVGKSEIMDMEVTISENLEAMHTLDNTKTPSRIKRTGFRTVEIAGTLKFDDGVEYQSFLDSDQREMILYIEGNTEVQSGYNCSLTIKTPLATAAEFPPNAGGPGEIEVPFTMKSQYSTSSGTSIQIELRNDQAAY